VADGHDAATLVITIIAQQEQETGQGAADRKRNDRIRGRFSPKAMGIRDKLR